MALPGRIACGSPPPPVKIRRAGTAYWTPSDLGTDLVDMAPSQVIDTPVLFVAGLNSFMLFGEMFGAGGTLLFIRVFLHDPVTETFLANREGVVLSPGPFAYSFGAFGQNGFLASPTRGDVWWLMSLQLENDFGLETISVDARLLGGTR